MKFVIPGYERASFGSVRVVALASCMNSIRTIVEQQSLHRFASLQADARVFHGRGLTYGVGIPGCGRVVVRHAHRGGVPRRLASDLFLLRLRPLRELVASFRLRALGVPTPEFIAYVTYSARPFFRYDVATREVADAADLADWLSRTVDPDSRRALIHSAAVLIDRLAEAGAHHSDLNAKNILLARNGDGFDPLVIDVDRVRFHVARSPMVMDANLRRLDRSLRKLRERGLHLTESELLDLRRQAKELYAGASSADPEPLASP
ncbi:MAG TPA: lipopolysaccharide kinase InaA family protein [Gemmatimonadaceae bacterium]|nr:lipopolysaccharide kinase InaA family protein [Gemmatimonadaceae bacterium]